MNAAEEAFGGGVFIADKSVWARSDKEPLRDEWARALLQGQIVTCDITRLELLYSARSGEDFLRWEEELDALWNIPTTHGIFTAAIAALRELAEVSDLYHRVKPPDALVAASAQEAGIGVLHYDHDFDRLAEVLNFESRWAAQPPALDVPSP